MEYLDVSVYCGTFLVLGAILAGCCHSWRYQWLIHVCQRELNLGYQGESPYALTTESLLVLDIQKLTVWFSSSCNVVIVVYTSCVEAATICPLPPASWPMTFWPWNLCQSHVWWATSVPILVFLGLSVLDLDPMYATDVRHASSLNAPYHRGGA